MRAQSQERASTERSHDWAIVLAGGSGRRLELLTSAGRSDALPKQYWSFRGSRSLLGDALARADMVAPPERTLVVVAEEHARHWVRELAHRPAENVIVQPANRGTAPGVLLPLLALVERDREARVALYPSDHFVERESTLARAMRAALAAADEQPDEVVLLGITPESPEPDYGWILPGGEFGPHRSVVTFAEKPGAAAAAALQRWGGVWNAFLLAARASALLALYERRLPALLASFRARRPHADADAAHALYGAIAPADFSRDVLSGSEPSLRLRLVPPCGWTDLGTPDRVARCRERLRAVESGPVVLARPLRDLSAALSS